MHISEVELKRTHELAVGEDRKGEHDVAAYPLNYLTFQEGD